MLGVVEIEAHDEVVERFDEPSPAEWNERRSCSTDSRHSGHKPDAVLDKLGRGLVRGPLHAGSAARRITYRSLGDGRIVLLTTFRTQCNSEWAEVARARKIAQDCAQRNP